MKMIKNKVNELFSKYQILCEQIRNESMEIFPKEIIDTIPKNASCKTIYSRRWQMTICKTGAGSLTIHCKYIDDNLNYTQFTVGHQVPSDNGLDIMFGATSGLEILHNYHLRNPIVSGKPVYYWNYDQISIKEIADFAAKIEHIKAMWMLVCMNSDEIIRRMKEDNHE